MKQRFTFLASAASVMLFSSSLFAGPGDTLGWTMTTIPYSGMNGNTDAAASATLYQSQAGGWIFGTNAESQGQITAMAQAYENQGPAIVKQALLLIRKKKKGPNPAQSKLTFRLHNLEADRALVYSGPPTAPIFDSVPGPGLAVLASGELLFDEIDTTAGAFTFIDFPTNPAITGNVAISCDFADFKAKQDTVGFLSGRPNSGQGLQYAFHQLTQDGANYWFPTQFLTTLDQTAAMFLVLDGPAGITELGQTSMVNGVRGILFPSPATQTATLQFEIEQNGSFMVDVISAAGKVVSTTDLGFRAAGKHQTEINVSGFAAGQYFYSIVDEAGQRYTKSFVVAK